jgi:hypothetical protein
VWLAERLHFVDRERRPIAPSRVIPVRYVLPLAILSASVLLPAAPRLSPNPTIEVSTAEVYCALVGPRELAKTEMMVGFTVRGDSEETYTVELYIEPDNTGEKATWVRSMDVSLARPAAGGHCVANDEFKIRSRGPEEAESTAKPHLPHSHTSSWTIVLVIKSKDKFIDRLGPSTIPFTPKRVRTPE